MENPASRTPAQPTAHPLTRPLARPLIPGLDHVVYGGDYTPEQWPEEVWREDVALMREAGVNLVSVGIFGWAMLEPEEGRFTFAWLDRVLDLLHGAGIAVDLATPTAAPPPWFLHRYPAARPVTAEGHVLSGGARQTLCPSSPEYAAAAARITERLARRYGEHPALALWHVHNEYGGAVPACYCATSAEAFREWLLKRYTGLDALNAAWGTAFWGQRYGDWAEIEPPRLAPTAVNPAQRLDFLRFSSDAHLDCYRRERDIVREWSPHVPVTTNFMIVNCKNIDYWRWAEEVDLVANDHYLKAERADNHIELAMAADVTRGLAGGRPWLVMEHSTSAVNWQPRNVAKRPGEMRRNSLAHLGRGADGLMFFQWRASRAGAEKFHSAMVPHGGTSTRVWREVAELGAELSALGPVLGSEVAAQAAIVWDWQSWWAMELEWRPTVDHGYLERVFAFYEWLWRAQVTVDFVRPDSPDLARYDLVVVPSLYLATAETADNLARYTEGGGTLVVSYFSGIVDANDAIHPGGHPGVLRELLGLAVEEFLPLRAGETAALDNGGRADVWAEEVVPDTAETLLRHVDGPAAGGPALTRNRWGRGTAYYVATRLDHRGLEAALGGLRPASVVPEGLPEGVEAVRRRAGEESFLVVLNHTGKDAEVPVAGADLLSGEGPGERWTIPAGGVRVLREDAGRQR